MKVRIMWADMRDGTYAKEWPGNVLHGELERWAMAKGIATKKRAGKVVQEGRPLAKSIHVIGAEEGSEWATSPSRLAALHQQSGIEYEKRQETAKVMEGMVETAIQALDGRLRTTSSEEIHEELRAEYGGKKEARLTPNKNQDREKVDLEAQWHSLYPEQKRGHRRDSVIIQAQLLRRAQIQEQMPAEELAKIREDEAKRAAKSLKTTEGIELELPRSGFFDRMKALIWRR